MSLNANFSLSTSAVDRTSITISHPSNVCARIERRTAAVISYSYFIIDL